MYQSGLKVNNFSYILKKSYNHCLLIIKGSGYTFTEFLTFLKNIGAINTGFIFYAQHTQFLDSLTHIVSNHRRALTKMLHLGHGGVRRAKVNTGP